ncbi:PepSY domain-containing protein [Paenibacillus sp. NPDC056579]|uniref:PepSY domain-containing protein n=1 Tax=unclassified Paenibacillus TaxID=185978 RepID=UPI001EF82E24|nr:PepSY domain-containing protein [Paenibacillus sp. H1-7]
MKNKWLLAAMILLAVEGSTVHTAALASHTVYAAPEDSATGVYEAEQAELEKQVKITKDQCIAIAMQKVQGIVQEIELGTEDGTIVYNVLIEDKKERLMEVKVDAVTGHIIDVGRSDDVFETPEDPE